MFTRFATSLLLVSSLAFVGCSAQPASEVDEDPSTLSSESKALSATGAQLVGDWYPTVQGPQHFALNKDDSYNWWSGIMCIRSPCPGGHSGRWATYINLYTGTRYVRMLSSDYTVENWYRIDSTSKLTGVFGTTGTYAKKVVTPGCTTNAECGGGNQCEAGTCVARQTCVQINGTDRYMAKNFAAGQYAEANAWGEANANGASWGISLATCDVVANDTVCAAVIQPVCGFMQGQNEASTVNSACELRRSVIAQAGNGGEALAYYTNGACTQGAAVCATYWLRQDPESPVGAYYVHTFDSEFEAQVWPKLHSGSVDAVIRQGRCDVPTACTEQYEPLCGGVRSDEPSTFGNKCEFEAAVRMSATPSNGDWSKGYISIADSCDH